MAVIIIYFVNRYWTVIIFSLFRAAIVYLKSANDAKAAVKDLNGCTLQGHTLCVQQLCGPTSTHQPNDQPHSTAETSKTDVNEVNRLRTKGASARVSMNTRLLHILMFKVKLYQIDIELLHFCFDH